ADDDGRPMIDVVERLHGPDAERLEIGDDALVVDDLAEGVRRLAGRGRLLGHVDRLADTVAEAGPVGDADLSNGAHPFDYRMRVGSSRFTGPGLGGRSLA